VGLTLVEPLADVDVNVPGVMAMLVAPVVAQVSVLLVPELMLVGFAVKDVIAGAEPFPEGGPEELAKPQPAKPSRTNRVRISAQSSSQGELRPRERDSFLQNELEESIGNSSAAVGHNILVISDLTCLLAVSTASGPWSAGGKGPSQGDGAWVGFVR
jgi:hypothetical protein